MLGVMMFPMRNGLMRTLIASLIVVLLLAQRHSGFMLSLVLLFLVPWLAYSGYRCIRFPTERNLRIKKAIVWFVAVLVIFSVHLVMYWSAKSYALSISEKIEAYISSHGQCPTELEDVGISKRAFKEHLGLGSYACKDQRPFFSMQAHMYRLKRNTTISQIMNGGMPMIETAPNNSVERYNPKLYFGFPPPEAPASPHVRH